MIGMFLLRQMAQTLLTSEEIKWSIKNLSDMLKAAKNSARLSFYFCLKF